MIWEYQAEKIASTLIKHRTKYKSLSISRLSGLVLLHNYLEFSVVDDLYLE